MKLSSQNIRDSETIPGEFAFCIPNDKTRVCLGKNLSPHLSWSDAPAGAQSFAIICVDPDVPSVGDNVNVEDREVDHDLPRADFYHWVLIDLPVSVKAVETGQFSSEVTPSGKAGPGAPLGARQGINDYTVWFAGDPDMRGDYYGYDGPCPPWNDLRVHRYVFTVYALDTAKLPIDGKFTGAQALEAMKGHILGQASITGTYTLNAALRV
ncbi:MAG: YbhB/YbcL family Raf kinase inhibitor-like protein [Rhodocyclaceae bacterium]|nr:YbhB/YbcL family Raf kinase inhibitor-like protein [Rhodocyclaceae bacterium]